MEKGKNPSCTPTNNRMMILPNAGKNDAEYIIFVNKESRPCIASCRASKSRVVEEIGFSFFFVHIYYPYPFLNIEYPRIGGVAVTEHIDLSVGNMLFLFNQ